MYMLNFDFNVSILGPSRRYWMEFLAKLVNRFKPLTVFFKMFGGVVNMPLV